MIKIKEKLIVSVFKFLNEIIPKNKFQILFDSDPDFADNSKAMYEFMVSNQLDKTYNLSWIFTDKNLLNNDSCVESFQKKSFRGILQFFRSKYFFTTHNSFLPMKSSKQYFISLWHGMPLKAMGYAEISDKPHLPTRNDDKNHILICTSTLMKSVMASCFYMNPNNVYVTGQPRNDKLFLNKNTQKNLNKFIKKSKITYNKIVLYTPTFRRWKSKTEGFSKENIFNFIDYDENIFREFLKENNILFMIKMHPSEEEYYSELVNNENIVIITSEMLQKEFLDLYDILGEFDILVTDYSSIYFDFLLLDKPIIFTPTDFEEYSKLRGFILEPYNFWSPGPKSVNFQDFLIELKNCIDHPCYYEKERKMVNSIINQYHDDKSCERIWALIRNLNEDY